MEKGRAGTQSKDFQLLIIHSGATEHSISRFLTSGPPKIRGREPELLGTCHFSWRSPGCRKPGSHLSVLREYRNPSHSSYRALVGHPLPIVGRWLSTVSPASSCLARGTNYLFKEVCRANSLGRETEHLPGSRGKFVCWPI